MVLVATGGRVRCFGNINVDACSSQQALPIRLLCTLPLRTCKHSNLLDNSWSDLLARKEKRKIEKGEFKGSSPFGISFLNTMGENAIIYITSRSGSSL